MKKCLLALSLLSLCFVTNAAEYQTSVGIGHQYGSILGVQFAYKEQDHKFYGSIGLIGVAAGFEKTFKDHKQHTYGLVVGKEEFQGEDGFVFATYNYHVSGFDKSGWVFGAGIGITREDESGFFGDNGKIESSTAFSLNVGYKF